MQNRLLLLFVFLFLTASLLQAQIPAMTLKRAAEKPIVLSGLDARVRIFGHLAETTMTMKFYNPNSRVLEGELEFPLPEGAVVSGYALDINGDLVEGVAVEKEKARVVLETEIRRGVDPGLVEKVKGNNFKTRVYPLNANSTRTVQVVYITELAVDDGEAKYRIPLHLTDKTENFSLRVEVLSADQQPEIVVAGAQPSEFTRMQSGWFSEMAMQRQKIDSEIEVTIPVPEPGAVFVEEAGDGNFYFSIQGLAADPEKNRAFKPATRIAVLFDATGSAAKRDLTLEKKFITALFASERVADSVEVEFVEFRNRPGKARELKIVRGSSEELTRLIDAVKFDGGTNFSGINGNLTRPDCYLLLSDGISTFGKSVMPEFDAPVYAVSSADGADYGLLQQVCRRSGGELLNLKSLDIERAVKMIGADFFGITGIVVSKGIEEVYPRGRQRVNPRYMLAGLLAGDDGEVTLSFGSGAGALERKYQINRKNAVKGDFLRKFWAGRKVDELLAEKEKNRLDIVTLSKKHGVVNEFTSLLVLERIDQYIEHRIVPPASKREWREQYFAAVEKAEAEVARTREEKLNSIIPQWEQRLSWYETDFSKAEAPSGKDKKSEGGSWYGALTGSGGASREEVGQAARGMNSVETDSMMPQEAAPSMAADEAMDMREESKALSVGAPSPAPAPSSSAMPSAKADSSSATEGSRSVNPGVAVKAWQPDARYARQIKEALDPYVEYLKQKVEYGNSPSFFLDCADVFIALKKQEIAIQVLSNIAEMELENPALMRILAHRLSQIDELATSAAIFEEVLELRKEEPQSYRDLALVLGRMGEYRRAVELLYEIVLKPWDGRFPEIEVIAIEELNSLVVKAKKAGISDFKIDSRLLKPVDVDLRIVMTWDADQTDMDLWVVEPSGEKAYYGYPRTSTGGLVSRDFTQGYGPEEYMVRKARTGMYEIQTNFFGSSSQKVAGAVTLQVDIFTNFGRENEKRRSVTLRLTDAKETFKVADIEF